MPPRTLLRTPSELARDAGKSNRLDVARASRPRPEFLHLRVQPRRGGLSQPRPSAWAGEANPGPSPERANYEVAMPQSLSKLYVHLIFSTKHRQPLLIPSVRGALPAYMATVLKNQDCPALKVGSPRDQAPPPIAPFEEPDLGGGGGESKNQFVEVAQDAGESAASLLLAERLRRIFRKPRRGGFGGRIHRRAGRASPGGELPGGVAEVSSGQWGGIRRTICVGLKVGRPFRAWSKGGRMLTQAVGLGARPKPMPKP
jgi:hypothetical protein